MRIAVIGGGLFGSTAAIYAARAGTSIRTYQAIGTKATTGLCRAIGHCQ